MIGVEDEAKRSSSSIVVSASSSSNSSSSTIDLERDFFIAVLVQIWSKVALGRMTHLREMRGMISLVCVDKQGHRRILCVLLW